MQLAQTTGRALFAAAACAATAAVAAPATIAYCDKRDVGGPTFDPEALERGAKAIREIDSSRNAKLVYDQLRQQELTRQEELKSKEEEYKAAAAQFALEQEKTRWEEQKKFSSHQAEQQQQQAQYNHRLAQERLKEENELNRQRNAEMVRMQEESVARQNEERLATERRVQAEIRATQQREAELQKQVQKEKAMAEAQGRIEERRKNEDVNRRELTLRIQEETKKMVEVVNVTFTHLGEGAVALLTDYNKMGMLVGAGTLLLLGGYTAREASRVGGQALARWLQTPSLVRETSRRSLFQLPKWMTRSAAAGPAKTNDQVAKDFSDIVLHEGLRNGVRSMAAVAANTKRHNAAFRHMMFYGPPGTGKTMVARRLAQTSGLEYAILSGGDVAPLGAEAVTKLHQLFDWANRSNRGLLLFIDEADAFLAKRGNVAMSEGLRSALNALLYRTGDQSKQHMLVLATNRPWDLDEAVLDRVDQALEFPLPGLSERELLISLYLEKNILNADKDGSSGPAISSEGVGLEEVRQAARLTQGMSGRELAKMVGSMQAACYGSTSPVLTKDIFMSVLEQKIIEQKRKSQFKKGEAIDAAEFEVSS